MPDDLHRLGQELITTSARIVRWVPKGDSSELSLAAVRLLARLSDIGTTRISDLAAIERSSQPTITNHVKRLEAAGLIERAADPHDARAWQIRISERGSQELERIRDSLGTSIEPYLAKLSRRDLKALSDAIEAMHRLMAMDRLPE